MDICRKLVSVEPMEGGYTAHLDNADLRIYFMTDRIVQIGRAHV